MGSLNERSVTVGVESTRSRIVDWNWRASRTLVQRGCPTCLPTSIDARDTHSDATWRTCDPTKGSCISTCHSVGPSGPVYQRGRYSNLNRKALPSPWIENCGTAPQVPIRTSRGRSAVVPSSFAFGCMLLASTSALVVVQGGFVTSLGTEAPHGTAGIIMGLSSGQLRLHIHVAGQIGFFGGWGAGVKLLVTKLNAGWISQEIGTTCWQERPDRSTE